MTTTDAATNNTVPPTRGRPRTVSLEQIVEAAIRVADRAGFEAVSLRAVGRELGMHPTSLYTYVADGDTLVGLLVEHMASRVRLCDVHAADPIAEVRRWCENIRALELAHPGLLHLAGHGPATATSARQADAVIGTLAAAGLDIEQARATYSLLLHFLFGATLSAAAEARLGPVDTGALLAAAAELPHLSAAVNAAMPRDADAAFHQELDLLLRVMVPALARRERTPAGPAQERGAFHG